MKHIEMQTKSQAASWKAPSGARRIPVEIVALICVWLGAVAAIAAPDHSHHSANSDRGFAYFHEEVAEVPWSIHVVKIQRTHTNLEFHTTLGQGHTMGMGVVSEQVKSFPLELGRPVAAVNGDFYRLSRDCPGDPEGLQIEGGELLSGPSPTRVCFWVDGTGQPHRGTVLSQFKVTWPDGSTTPLGLNEERAADQAVLYTSAKGQSTRASGGIEFVLQREAEDIYAPLRIGETFKARVREIRTAGDTTLSRDRLVLSLGPRLSTQLSKLLPGAILQFSMASSPDLSGVQTAIGGGPTLVSGGKAAQWNGAQMRHPRTAIGWNKDFIFLVEVDGRQGKLSVGMTFPELAAYLVKLGCEEAMNLDGGGSATMWVYGNVMNSPSEGHERPAANALVVIDKNKRRILDPRD